MSTKAGFWNRAAARYARKPVANPEAFERKIALTRALIAPRGRLLDIGCGTGSLALRLAPDAAEVHGLDVSEEMIRIAREKARAAGIDSLRFHVGPFDARFDAIAEQSLDLVCAFSLLHLLRDRQAALRQMHALLRPGGHLISSTPCLAESRLPLRPLIACMRWLGLAPPVAFFDRATLMRDIAEAGFTAITPHEVGNGRMVAFVIARRP